LLLPIDMDDHEFLRRVSERLACDQRRAEGLTVAVFGVLRARLTAKEGADIAAQLPSGLKHLWQETHAGEHGVEKIHAPEFVGRVRRAAGLPDDQEAEHAVRAVFAALQRLLGSPTGKEGEAWDVFSVLPKDLKALWLAAGQDH
jgi:uncharacterized protein (DUF2267 family)